MEDPEPRCPDCHFLCTRAKDEQSNPFTLGPVSKETRDKLNKSKETARNWIIYHVGNTPPCCYKEVWSSPFSIQEEKFPEETDKILEELQADRKEKCFFFQYREKLSFEAAEELEKRKADRREAQKDRKHTWWLVLATLGLVVVNIVLVIATLINSV